MSILEIELTPEMDNRLREKARRKGLTVSDYARALVAEDLQQEVPEQPKHSIMELEGLGAATWDGGNATSIVDGERRFDVMDFHGVGRDSWKGVDVQEYINEMRDEWDA